MWHRLGERTLHNRFSILGLQRSAHEAGMKRPRKYRYHQRHWRAPTLMKNIRTLILASILTFGLGALAFGSFTVAGGTLNADTSGQPNEYDVGSLNGATDALLADTSGQPNEYDVG